MNATPTHPHRYPPTHPHPHSAIRFSRLLLTGAAGGLGCVLRPRLKAYCDVLRLSDAAPMAPATGGEEVVPALLQDAAAITALLAGVDAVVHMGGISTEQPFAQIVQANIVGVYNLYEAARTQGVKRVVFASSNHVTGFYTQGETITPGMPARPDSHYGISKAFGEDLSRFYFDRHGIETVCLRIGSSFPEPIDRRMLASWLSYDDLERLVVASLTAPVVGHSIIYGVSNNPLTWWDNTAAKHIGFVPQDSAEPYRAAIEARQQRLDPSQPEVRFQGGGFVVSGPL